MSITINISHGEFLDKLTILQIKSERIEDKDKRVNIDRELQALVTAWEKEAGNKGVDVEEQILRLKKINEKLWDIEDAIREREKNKQFDNEFIELARAVYITNDERASIKKEINMLMGSALVEEKSYSDYT